MMARSEIMALKGLKGNRVGVNVRGIGAYLLVNALESAGMTMIDIQMAHLIHRVMNRYSRIKASRAGVHVLGQAFGGPIETRAEN
jgi:ABC-type nitrate/sulfonate/bicarbonate transport system substrate-binding protein